MSLLLLEAGCVLGRMRELKRSLVLAPSAFSVQSFTTEWVDMMKLVVGVPRNILLLV